MNPFLSKPLKKVQPGSNIKNSSQEHRPSKFINPNISKNPKIFAVEKKITDTQKIRNSSPKDKNTKNSNNINLINFNKPIKEDDINTKNIVNSGQNNINIEIKDKEEIINDEEEKVKNKDSKKETNIKKFTKDLTIENCIKFMFTRIKTEKLIFNNNEEILDYIKNQLKEGKIKNLIQKLELNKNDFTGFTLSKKNKGYTIYEIEIEEDLDKINESLKKQKVEINKKPIEIKYIIKEPEKFQVSSIIIKKEPEIKEKKNNENKKQENYIYAIKNKTIEREIASIKNDKINSEIKNLQKQIHKHKEELRNEENNKKDLDKKANVKSSKINNLNLNNLQIDNDTKSKRRENGLKIKTNPKKEEENGSMNTMPNLIDKNDKKTMTNEENQKKASRALARFKKALSSNKNKEEDNGPGNSDKIKSIAAILQEHIIKPLAEIQEESENMKPRGASVECRSIRTEGMAELLNNAPQKKNVKKPKLVNFGE